METPEHSSRLRAGRIQWKGRPNSMLDQLLTALEAAHAALHGATPDAAPGALDDAVAALSGLRSALDAKSHPELSAYLQSVYDRCLLLIGEARQGRAAGLAPMITLLWQIRSNQEDAQQNAWQEESPSTIVRSLLP